MRVLRLFLCLSMFLAFTACSVDDDKTISGASAADKVKMEEHNRLVRLLNEMGSPRSSWSEAKLNLFDQRLSRLEVLGAQLRGQPGISLASNLSTTTTWRSRLITSRATKNTTTTLPPVTNEHAALKDEFIELKDSVRPRIEIASAEGYLLEAQTIAEIEGKIVELESLISINDQLVSMHEELRDLQQERLNHGGTSVTPLDSAMRSLITTELMAQSITLSTDSMLLGELLKQAVRRQESIEVGEIMTQHFENNQ